MRTRRFTLALVAILAALAALAACGGEDGGLTNRSSGDERKSDDQSSNDDESSDDTTADDESSDDTTSDDESSDDESSSGDSGDFCSLYQTYVDGADSTLSGDASPEELRDLYEAFDEIAGPLADAAPSEISDDVDTLIEVGQTMGDVLEQHDYDITEAMSDPALSEALSDDFIGASSNVGEYVATNC